MAGESAEPDADTGKMSLMDESNVACHLQQY